MKRPPKYCGPHDPSGVGFVYVNGKPKYFKGCPYDSPESLRMYEEHCNSLKVLPADTTKVVGLALRYLDHSKIRHDGKPEYTHRRTICTLLGEKYPKLLVSDFGPLKLQEFRESLLQYEWTRTYINQQIQRVKGCFRWGVSQEIVRVEVLQALETVAGLRAGEGGKPSKVVTPANPDHVAQALAVASPTIQAAITLLAHTGMRASNLCSLRWEEINRTGDIWLYSPKQHKSLHRGKVLVVPLGPRCQAALKALPGKQDGEWLLSPRDAVYWHAEQRGTRSPKISTKIGTKYNKDSLRQAIHYACDKARVPHFNPHQLRHSISTAITAKHGIEASRLFLGHSSVNVTKIYSERDIAAAAELARHFG